MSRLIINRGLPGSGKTFLSLTKYPNAIVCSADDFFVNKNGEYVWRQDHLDFAHRYCQKMAYQLMKSNLRPDVVIDNTNICREYYQYYLNLAETFNYEVIIEELYDGGLTDEQLAARNQHAVPIEHIAKMRARWNAELNPIGAILMCNRKANRK